MLRLTRLAALVLCVACVAPPPGDDPDGDGSLLTSVQATTFGADSVLFMLQVTNVTEAPAPLEFASGQSFDFVVTSVPGGDEVWRWSSDMMFTQAVRSESLAAGETRTYAASWAPAPGQRGEFEVHGTLAATNVRAEQSARFRVE